MSAGNGTRPPEVWLIAGTRPEAIKLAPVVERMRAAGRLAPVPVASGQHPGMVSQALSAFDITPAISVGVHRTTGSQPELLAGLIDGLEQRLAERPPAAVMVQGDTTTTLAGALVGFWRQLPVVHLEAGLRSGDLAAPFPEEGNRRAVSPLSALHLAPTRSAVANLRTEGVPAGAIRLTGNTVVDAAQAVARRRVPFADPRLAEVSRRVRSGAARLALVTAHRRESWGPPLSRVLQAVRELVAAYPDLQVVLPSHPNPAVREQVDAGLAGLPRVVVTDPLPYEALMRLLSEAYLVLTDSGGIQEEAPSFGVPVLVLREVTERVESVTAGCAVLVGTDRDRILASAEGLLREPARRAAMVAGGSPYGDGHAAGRAERAVAQLLDTNRHPQLSPAHPVGVDSGGCSGTPQRLLAAAGTGGASGWAGPAAQRPALTPP